MSTTMDFKRVAENENFLVPDLTNPEQVQECQSHIAYLSETGHEEAAQDLANLTLVDCPDVGIFAQTAPTP